jgi:PAS domain S-box-containing protein
MRTLKDANGNTIGTQGTAYDITERKRAELTLKESEKRYRTLFETAADAIFVSDMESRYFLDVNNVACESLGYSKKELLQMTPEDIVHPDYVSPIPGQIEDIRKRGPATFEAAQVRRDGRTISTEVRQQIIEYGERPAVLSIVRDITERKQAEVSLRESEERYRIAIEHSNDGVSILKGDQRIYVNQRYLDMFGYEDPNEVLGKPLSLTVHPDDLKKLTDLTLRVQTGESVPSSLEIKSIRKDGTFFDIEATMARTTYRGEAVTLAYLRDITERKQAEQEKIQLEKLGALGRLVGGIAHELNNPMTGMLNFTDYCLKNTSKDNKIYPILEDTKRETERCCKIVGNLLTFSRMEKEDEEKYEKVSVSTVFDRVFSLLSFRIEKENILLTQEYDKETPEIWIKASNMQQVFLNLVANALDAVKESKKKELRVEIFPNGKFVHVIITDSGCGISSENLQNIFDPFFTTKPPGQGTGLGLSVCNNLVRTHGGKITCESEVDSGTKFNVLLPIDKRAKHR